MYYYILFYFQFFLASDGSDVGLMMVCRKQYILSCSSLEAGHLKPFLLIPTSCYRYFSPLIWMFLKMHWPWIWIYWRNYLASQEIPIAIKRSVSFSCLFSTVEIIVLVCSQLWPFRFSAVNIVSWITASNPATARQYLSYKSCTCGTSCTQYNADG